MPYDTSDTITPRCLEVIYAISTCLKFMKQNAIAFIWILILLCIVFIEKDIWLILWYSVYV